MIPLVSRLLELTVSVKFSVSTPMFISRSNPVSSGLITSAMYRVTFTAFNGAISTIKLPNVSAIVSEVKKM